MSRPDIDIYNSFIELAKWCLSFVQKTSIRELKLSSAFVFGNQSNLSSTWESARSEFDTADAAKLTQINNSLMHNSKQTMTMLKTNVLAAITFVIAAAKANNLSNNVLTCTYTIQCIVLNWLQVKMPSMNFTTVRTLFLNIFKEIPIRTVIYNQSVQEDVEFFLKSLIPKNQSVSAIMTFHIFVEHWITEIFESFIQNILKTTFRPNPNTVFRMAIKMFHFYVKQSCEMRLLTRDAELSSILKVIAEIPDSFPEELFGVLTNPNKVKNNQIKQGKEYMKSMLREPLHSLHPLLQLAPQQQCSSSGAAAFAAVQQQQCSSHCTAAVQQQCSSLCSSAAVTRLVAAPCLDSPGEVCPDEFCVD